MYTLRVPLLAIRRFTMYTLRVPLIAIRRFTMYYITTGGECKKNTAQIVTFSALCLKSPYSYVSPITCALTMFVVP